MKRVKNKRRVKGIVKVLTLLIFFILISLSAQMIIRKDKERKLEEERTKLTENIKSKYSEIVKTTKESTIYEKVDNEYKEVGKLGANVTLNLNEIEIYYYTKYFEIKDLNYYISYEDIESSTEETVSNRYKSYIVFNKNIKTTSPTKFYDETGNLYIELNKEFDLPIIIYDTDKYGVEYNNRLLYVNKDNVSEVVDANNTTEKVRTNIRTFTYHTVYQKGTETCTNSAVCHPIEKFEEQMKYIHDAGYLTLTLNEMEMFLDGKIRVPKNTIVITLDDGRKLHNSIPIIEKYEINATFFIITSLSEYKDYLDKDLKYAHFESHTDNLHHNYVCSGGYYGGEMLCTENSKVVADLKLSQEKLGGATYFAYPFFDFNDNGISALKKAGFKMAFIGQYNTNGYSNSKTNRYKIPRKTIFGTDSLKVLKSYLPESE